MVTPGQLRLISLQGRQQTAYSKLYAHTGTSVSLSQFTNHLKSKMTVIFFNG